MKNKRSLLPLRITSREQAHSALKSKIKDKFPQEDISEFIDQELIQQAKDKFGVDLEQVKNKIPNSYYQFSIRQVFSFLQTKQISAQNTEIKQDQDYKVLTKTSLKSSKI